MAILGYSFSVADEHFNDLIRKGNREAKLIVVDPNLEGTTSRVCQTVGQDRATLRPAEIEGMECKVGGRLCFVRAKAEDLNSTRLAALLQRANAQVQSKK